MALTRQCALLGLPRSTYYYDPAPLGEADILLCHALDRLNTDHPYYGVERMTDSFRKQGYSVGPKRVRRLLRTMGLEAIYPSRASRFPSPGIAFFPIYCGEKRFLARTSYGPPTSRTSRSADADSPT